MAAARRAAERRAEEEVYKKDCDYFEFYRDGEGLNWVEANRAPTYLAWGIPRTASAWPGTTLSAALQASFTDPLNYAEVMGSPTSEDMGPHDHDDARLRRILRRTRLLVTGPDKFNLNFVKILGMGGSGIAALFQHAVDNRFIVIKTTLVHDLAVLRGKGAASRSLINGERTRHNRFRNAMHVANVLRLRGPAGAAPRDPSELLVFEYCHRGDLKKGIVRIANEKSPIQVPDALLWSIFDCFYRMTVALDWPPPTAVPARLGSFPGYTRGQPYYEQQPTFKNPLRSLVPHGWIHLDINPANILVGDHEPGRHANHPVLKLHDFGLAHQVQAAQRTSYRTQWKLRIRGTPGWYTPEQFTSEWDHVGRATRPLSTTVAGQYSWKTNMWGLGQIMWCIITGYHPTAGPYPMLWPSAGGPGVAQRYSYGVLGLDPPAANGTAQNVDPELRDLVIKCMMDAPADRPNRGEIETILARKLPVGADPAIIAVSNQIFTLPPVPTAVSIANAVKILRRRPGAPGIPVPPPAP